VTSWAEAGETEIPAEATNAQARRNRTLSICHLMAAMYTNEPSAQRELLWPVPGPDDSGCSANLSRAPPRLRFSC